MTIADYCATGRCESLDAALHDPLLCPAYHQACGCFDLIFQMGVDTGDTLYYDDNGVLVAFVSYSVPTLWACDGPASWVEPQCDSTMSSLTPACASP